MTSRGETETFRILAGVTTAASTTVPPKKGLRNVPERSGEPDAS